MTQVVGSGFIPEVGNKGRQLGGNIGAFGVVFHAFHDGGGVGGRTDHIQRHLFGNDNGVFVIDGDLLAPVLPVLVKDFTAGGLNTVGIYLRNADQVGADVGRISFDSGVRLLRAEMVALNIQLGV